MSTEKKTKAKSTGTKKTAEKVSAPEELKPYKYEDEHFVDSSRKVWNYSLLTEEDVKNFQQGTHYRLYEKMGSHAIQVNGIWGMYFAVWAPNATGVSLVADFNHWNGRMCPMRSLGASGIWELFVPGLVAGEKYKFEIRTREGYLRVKSDPMAFYSEMRPLTASVVCDVDTYPWRDQEWKQRSLNSPMNIYEVHLGSWKNYGEDHKKLLRAVFIS